MLPSSAPHVWGKFHLSENLSDMARSGGTLHHLILILIDDGLAHFWDVEPTMTSSLSSSPDDIDLVKSQFHEVLLMLETAISYCIHSL